MAKMTLLEMVQKILSSMDSDEVNSISDTVESLQVVDVIEDTYTFLFDNKIVPELHTLYTVDSLGDSSRPNMLKLPTSAVNLLWFKYDVSKTGETTSPVYRPITYLSPEEWLALTSSRDASDSTVTLVTDVSSSVRFLIKNDKAPEYWTSFDDEYMVFDSYDSAEDATLQASKSQAYGVKETAFLKEDSFVPDIDANFFSLFYNEAKSAAFIELKQVSNSMAEKRARKQLTKLQNDKHRFSEANKTRQPNYGRRSRK